MCGIIGTTDIQTSSQQFDEAFNRYKNPDQNINEFYANVWYCT